MTVFKPTLAPAALAIALFAAMPEAGANTVTDVVNKSDLGIALIDVTSNADGKGDCNCAGTLDGGPAPAGSGEAAGPVIIAPAAAPPAGASESNSSPIAKRFACVVKNEEHWVYTQEVCDSLRASAPEPTVKAKAKKIRRIAMQDGNPVIRRKSSRASACVFGAPNASGCKQN